jgi:hypothetical protein
MRLAVNLATSQQQVTHMYTHRERERDTEGEKLGVSQQKQLDLKHHGEFCLGDEPERKTI